MTAKPFNADYNPTTITQTETIQWTFRAKLKDKTLITILDIVSPNPRLTSTAHGNPNGIILMYDPKEQSSVQYVIDVINTTPANIPIAVVTNYQDLIPTDMHPNLFPIKHKFYHINGSMKTNLGLAEIASWLEYPRMQQKYNIYKDLMNNSAREISRLNELFTPGEKHLLPMDNIKNDNFLDEPDADGFWSDDGDTPKRKKHKRKDKERKSESIESQTSSEKRGNPNVIRKKRQTAAVIVPKQVSKDPSIDFTDQDAFMDRIAEAAQNVPALQGAQPLVEDEEMTVFARPAPQQRHKKHHSKHRTKQAPAPAPIAPMRPSGPPAAAPPGYDTL